jgi:DNA-binding transcriptional regulator GbsR (MarR family)
MDQRVRADYVERWARLLESQGEPRIAGRIYAHLATSEERWLSLNELAEQLDISRGSVSTNTRRLIEMGLISRVAVPGSRREHYAADADAAHGMMQRAAAASRAVEALAREGLELQSDRVAPGGESLRVMADMYGRLADVLESDSVRTDASSAGRN